MSKGRKNTQSLWRLFELKSRPAQWPGQYHNGYRELRMKMATPRRTLLAVLIIFYLAGVAFFLL